MTQHIKDSFSQIFSFTRVYWSDCRCGTKNWCPWSKHMTCNQRVTLYQALVRSLGSPKTALNLLHVWGRKVVVSFKNNFGFVKCVSYKTKSCNCVSVVLTIPPHYPSLFVKLAHMLSGGRFKSAQQLTEVLSTPEELSFAADFDQVSSFGLGGTFPDNFACCGNRNLKVSGDTRVALSVHTCYIFMSDLRWFGFSSLALRLKTLIIGTFIWWCWNWVLSCCTNI